MKLQRFALLIIFMASYFTVSAQFITIGSGWRINADVPVDSRYFVNNLIERDAIIFKYEGLIVYVKSTEKNYQLVGGKTNVFWVELSGSSSSMIAGLGIYFTQDTVNAYFDSALWNALKLQGKNISSVAPTDGQVLSWDNTNSFWKGTDVQNSLIPYTGINIFNDTISALNTTNLWNANQLQGYDVSSSVAPVYDNYVLAWDSANKVWNPSPLSSGTFIPNVYTAGIGLNLFGSEFSAKNTDAIWNANQLQGSDISSVAPTDGQLLSWDNANTLWKPIDGQSILTASTGIKISNDSISALNTTNLWNANQLQGYDVSSSVAPVYDNYVLAWDSANKVWNPSPLSSGTFIPNVYTAGIGLNLIGSQFSSKNTDAIWNSNELQGIAVTTTAPVLGQVLSYNGTDWTPTDMSVSLLGGNGIDLLPIGGQTLIQVDYNTGLDISGGELIARTTEALWNAGSLQGSSISTSAPIQGQFLAYDGANWTPMDVASVMIDGDGINITDDTISVDYSTGLDISGGQLIARTTEALWNANQLQGTGISTTAPTSIGEVLTFDGSDWAPSTVSSILTAGEGIDILNDTISVKYGNGLIIAGNQLITNIGNGLEFNGSAIQTKLGLGLEFDADNFRIDLGNGLLFNANTVEPDLGTGLEFDANKIRADLGDGLTLNVNDIVVDYSTGLNILGGQLVARTTEALWNANQLQGTSISNSTPTTGQILYYDGIDWTPTTATSILTGGDGIDITNDTISVDYSTGLDILAGQLIARTSEALWNANQLQGTGISTTAPATIGEVLSYDGTDWSPSTITSILTGGEGIDITSNTVSVDLNTNSGLEFAGAGSDELQVDGYFGILVDANGISVDPDAGLSVSATGVSVIGYNGILVDANGVSVELDAGLSGLEFSGTSPNKTLGIADLGVTNPMLVNDDITFGDGTTIEAINLGEALTITGTGAAAVTYSTATNTFTIDATNTTYSGGDGIDLTGSEFSIDLDTAASGLELTGTTPNQTLGVSDLGVTNAMLAGSIDDTKLTSDYIQTTEVDNSTIEFTGGTLNVVDDGITTVKILDANVTNAKLANDDITFGDGTITEAINLGEALTLTGSGAAVVTYTSATNTFTIDATNTTYTGGDGIDLTGGAFSVDLDAVGSGLELSGTSPNQTLGVSETAIEGFISNDITDNYIPYDNGTKLVASNMYFDGTNIGIGTSSPNATLEVNGQIRTNVLRETSDARFKDNIFTIPNALEKTLALRGVNYKWKEEFANKNNLEKSERLGLIAQEVEKVIPQVVTTDNDGYKSICYSSLSGLLIEAIKDQNNVINNHNETIENQRAQIEAQNSRINALFELLEKNGIILE